MNSDCFNSTSREIAGRTVTVNWYPDYDAGTPWEREDGHGEVSEWTRRDKAPGEMVLCSNGGQKRYYDFAAAVATARADGWDTEPFGQGTPGERAHRAAMADFEYLRRWCADQWEYVGYVVEIDGEEYPEGLDDSALWGIDSDSMKEFEKTAFESAEKFLTVEADARHDAACRDIATV